MNILEMNEIGKFIRKTRKERGLRLEDLSDEHISTATISNIERGVPHVNKDKVLYLMSKLGLDLDEIPQMIEKDSETLESAQVKFIAVETMIQIGNVQRALTILSNISEESHSRHQATVHFLKGKCFMLKKDWRKAERELSEAVRLAFQDPYSPKTNLEAASYHALAQCRSMHRDWEQALKFVERGLEVFKESKSNFDQVQYMLLISRIVYLDKLGRSDEALKYLDELWQQIPQIHNNDIILQMFVLRVDLLRRMKLYHDAIRYAREGIQLAVNSRSYDDMYKLWFNLGIAYMEIQQLDDAEICFTFALDLSDQVSIKQDVLRTYCLLGQLYTMKGKYEQAKNHLKQAIELAERLHDMPLLNNALLMMGKLMKKMKNFVDAVGYLERAVQVAGKHRFKQQIYRCYYELASCYEEMGNMEGFKEATEKMYRAQKEMQVEDPVLL
jgi:tetratricopeptide (TPR) repeat protein